MPSGGRNGNAARRPAAQAARRQESRRAEAGIARAGVPLAGRAGRVLKQQDVVYRLGISRPYIERAHPARPRRARRDGEALVQVGTLGRDGEGRAHLGLQVGLAELPAIGKPRRRRSLAGIAFRRAGLGPARQGGDLRGREFPLIVKSRFGG